MTRMHMTAINGSATSVEAKIQNEFPFFKALKKKKKENIFYTTVIKRESWRR